ncbi:hypothetical protein CPB85DRAFT_1251709 [Mucidula mucida]|nr:hypothetical protein CPB85DRAFT_1251709 [Mucidula mucida]
MTGLISEILVSSLTIILTEPKALFDLPALQDTPLLHVRAVNDEEKADKLETATAAQNEGVLLYNRESKAQRGSRQCTDLWESFYLRQSSSPAGANTHLGNMLKYP